MDTVLQFLSERTEVDFWKAPGVTAVMQTTRFIFITCFVFTFISQVFCLGLKNKCNCGPTSGGGDICGCQDVVVRPPLPQKLPVSKLHEMGISKLKLEEEIEHIQPVPVPKFDSSPYYKHEYPYKFDKATVPYPHNTFYPNSRVPSRITDFETHDNSDISDYAEEEDDGFYYPDNNLPIAPVDAVTLSLAQEFARRAGTALTEDDLNFGPRTVPKDVAVIKARKGIPEERLHGFDKQVVEIRYPSAKYGLSHRDAAAVQEETYGEEGKYGGSANYRSSTDLGYVPETLKKHQFSVRPIDSYNDHIIPYEEKGYLRTHPKPCHRRGPVRVRNHEDVDYSGEEVSQYNWEDREEGRHFRIKPEEVKKGYSQFNKFKSNSSYNKHIGTAE